MSKEIDMRKIITIAQTTILIMHFTIIMWHKIDRNVAIEAINIRAYELRDATIEFNKALEEINPKLDSLNKHKHCFK